MKRFRIVPLQGQCVVKPDEAATQVGRILLPDSAQEKPHWGTVIEVGPPLDGKPVLFKKGDTVLFNRFAGAHIDMPKGNNSADTAEFRVLSFDNIMARLESLDE